MAAFKVSVQTDVTEGASCDSQALGLSKLKCGVCVYQFGKDHGKRFAAGQLDSSALDLGDKSSCYLTPPPHPVRRKKKGSEVTICV